MNDFFQVHYVAIVLLLTVFVLALLISFKNIDLKKYGELTAFTTIFLSLVAALLLMKENHLQAILLKVFVVFCILLLCVVLFVKFKKEMKK